MIFKILLALFFGLGLVLALILTIKSAVKSGDLDERIERTQQDIISSKEYKLSAIPELETKLQDLKAKNSKWEKIFATSLIVLIICVVAFLLVPFNFYTINAGEAAVVKHLGEAKEIRTPGTYANFWMTNKIEKYDIKVRTIDIKTMTYSNDAQTMDIEMTIQYHINQDKLIEIANQYGDIAMLENKIQSASIEKTKSILSSYKAMEIIANRSEMSPLVSRVIKETITEDYYVTITTVVLTNIDFTDAFEKAVEEKMIAEQKKLQADYENETTIAKAKAEADAKIKVAEAEIKVAEAKAQVLLIEAEADKNAKAELAKATAIKLKYNAVEIAKSLGLDVTENFDEEGNLESYIIDYTGDTDNTKAKLVATYLEYVIYLETWDGELPNTLVTDGTATIMVTP